MSEIILIYLIFKKNKFIKILKEVKIIKSAFSDNTFSLLIPDAFVIHFMKYNGPFQAHVVNKSDNSIHSEMTSNTVENKKSPIIIDTPK